MSTRILYLHVECVSGCVTCPGGTCTECETGFTYDGSKCVGNVYTSV